MLTGKLVEDVLIDIPLIGNRRVVVQEEEEPSEQEEESQWKDEWAQAHFSSPAKEEKEDLEGQPSTPYKDEGLEVSNVKVELVGDREFFANTSPQLTVPFQGEAAVEGRLLLDACSFLTPSLVRVEKEEDQEALNLQVRYFVRLVVRTEGGLDFWQTQEVWLDRLSWQDQQPVKQEEGQV